MATQAKTIRMIPDTEQFSPKVEHLAGKRVRSTFSFRRTQNEPRYEKSIVFDFSGMSEEELLEMCLSTAKVRAQGMLRALDPAVMLNADTLSQISVKGDIVDAPARSADPNSQAIKSLMKTGLSQEEAVAALQAAHQKAEARKMDGKKGKAVA